MRVFVIGGVTSASEKPQVLERAGREIGKTAAKAGHSLVLCSPFEDAIDRHVLRGAAEGARHFDLSPSVEFIYVDTPDVSLALSELQRAVHVAVARRPQAPPAIQEGSIEDQREGMKYSWLLCQLKALESCHGVIALGGRLAGSMNMLLALAESKKKPVLPLPRFGGAAQQAYYRRHYELQDGLREGFDRLTHERASSYAVDLLHRLAMPRGEQPELDSGTLRAPKARRFFISYPRARTCEADFVETLLRRRQQDVFRDESDFGAGHAIPEELRERIYASNVFIATWCAEYACSPWCYDELEIALDRHARRQMDIWLLCIDDTRLVPPRARDLVSYRATTRKELEAYLLDLLQRTQR